MSVQAKPGMTVDAFLAWAEGRPGRYELIDGEVVAMSPQRARHAETKFSVQTALRAALRAGDLPCRMLPDGMSVKIDAGTVFEPDALVYCGAGLDPDAIVVPKPMIVVEVLSPGTKRIDTGRKLQGYFRLPSVMHYLIVDAERHTVIHHRRGDGDLIETRIASSGELRLDPPDLTLPVAALFDA
ncbi:Uma2 family endonuclease [Methylorubrum salsuginis]|uniref:Endonuclease, Uma2 family (Restriction endonuclease fold) n=1 Tax=Methylorubrum salsuginis TaxID=414703 RepID=A0A1I4GGM0_9HYPH|nr:Uma2 family endonuclease [Methylorubrum salsuginis]SFL29009.1 Endonuclease, Uma2 family (restriction endonuclease fold) [Methylorubrum salsuginis]